MAWWLRQHDDRSRPAQCNFRVGNAGRNIVTGPGLRWSQVSAQKNFRFTERWTAQLRWDFQNALKTYNFTGPTKPSTSGIRGTSASCKTIREPPP